MSYLCNLTLDGALNGVSYALVALAFVLVYKASSMMNFAIGEWTTLGALSAGTGLYVLHLGVVAAMAFAGLAMFALAAGTAGDFLRRHRGFLRFQRWFAGASFVGLGVTAALATRK